ncbi:hypothetical protein AB0B13_30035 [Streptomyces sp. NPDC042898]|uniref:hypothetical protein n=1 Tax=unclassified Streptomyces TaxID=2593676 RepID=UPI0033240D1C
MATPQRAEAGHGRDHVSMGELLASCAAARALSTPPSRPGPEQGEGSGRGEGDGGEVLRRDEAA